MMHCGPQKGVVLEEFLLERYRAHQQRQQQQPPPQPFVIVELGSYCGYSAIRMARALSSSTETNDFHIYSIDVQPKLLRIATEMTRLAGLDHCISFHVLRQRTSLHHLLQEILGADKKGGDRSEQQGTKDDTTMKMIHFCLLDHAKDLYLPDLLQLERHGHLRRGSAVAADNVIFARIDDYRRHVQSAVYISTRLVVGPLEYQEEIPDGIGASLLCFCFGGGGDYQDHTTHLPSAFVFFSFYLGARRCVYTYNYCRAFGLRYGSNDKCRSSRPRTRMKTIQELEKVLNEYANNEEMVAADDGKNDRVSLFL
jgi:predicted O-methyltransferase YrrM